MRRLSLAITLDAFSAPGRQSSSAASEQRAHNSCVSQSFNWLDARLPRISPAVHAQGAIGLSRRKRRKQHKKSPSAEQSVSPCSTASAANEASGTKCHASPANREIRLEARVPFRWLRCSYRFASEPCTCLPPRIANWFGLFEHARIRPRGQTH